MDSKLLFILGILLLIGSVVGYTLTATSITKTFMSTGVGYSGETLLIEVIGWNPITILSGSAGVVILLIAGIGLLLGSVPDE